MYTYIDDKNKLFNGCKVCLTVKEAKTSELKTMKEDVDLSTIINRNPYLLDDNTLSITENPKYNLSNEDCKTNTSKEKFSFISYKYNVNELKFLYKCISCNHSWTNKLYKFDLKIKILLLINIKCLTKKVKLNL